MSQNIISWNPENPKKTDRTLWADNTSKLTLASESSNERELKRNISGKALYLFNLGVYWDQDDPFCKVQSTLYHTTGLMGIMPVLWQGETSPDTDHILAIRSRWGDPMSMLDVVLQSDDYAGDSAAVEPKIKTWNEWQEIDLSKKNEEILYGIVSDLPEIHISGKKDEHALNSVANVASVFVVYQFLEQLERICKRLVKQSSLPCEENLVGKVKGRILIHKQIKENFAKGRSDRVYCSYNKMSMDNIENRILKYALHLCKTWSNERGSIFSDKIVFCEGVLKPVKLVKVTRRDIMSVKNNGAFKDYKKGIKLAGDILQNLSVEFHDGQKPTVHINAVKPFFLNMNLLFELYCRALLEKAAKQTDLTLDPKENSEKSLFQDTLTGFQRNHVLDILIIGASKNSEEKDHKLILDAKYSLCFGANEASVREYTHQVLSYMLIWDADACGFIYPIPGKNTAPKETDQNYYKNPVIKRTHCEMDGIAGKKRYAVSVGIYEDAASAAAESDHPTFESLLKEVFKLLNNRTER